jgi:hypothetical protein
MVWDYWDNLNNGNTIKTIGIKVACKDPYYYMPYQSTIQLNINIPP